MTSLLINGRKREISASGDIARSAAERTPAAPALENAILAATGRRVRNLPFGNAKLGQA